MKNRIYRFLLSIDGQNVNIPRGPLYTKKGLNKFIKNFSESIASYRPFLFISMAEIGFAESV